MALFPHAIKRVVMIYGPMRFVFENLGPVKEARLELGDLTVISGRNNTGKTYMAYAVHGFMEKFAEVVLSDPVSEFFDTIFQEMVSMPSHELGNYLNFYDRKEWKVDQNTLAEQRSRLIREVSSAFSRNELNGVFAAREALFEEASLEADLEAGLQFKVSERIRILEDRELHIRYDGNSVSMEVRDNSLESEHEGEDDLSKIDIVTEQNVNRLYSYLLLRGVFETHLIPSIFSSARHTIPLFLNELDYANNQWIQAQIQDRLSGKSAERPGRSEPKKNIGNYALPVHNNIDLFRGIPDRVQREDNKPAGRFSAEVERMMGGRFSGTDGELRFKAGGEDEPSFDIPLYLASSSAWEMSGLYFYLGFFMNDNRSHLIIIDEPESHLDTANQIRLTRLLARLVNSGNKVLITTHSDYIVREINNLIMLTAPLEDGDKIKRKLGYEKDDELGQDQVKAYVAGEGTLKECRKNKYGIEMPVFDETIDDLNFRSEELASQIMMKDSEG